MRIIIKNKEITNPFVRLLVGFLVFVIFGLLLLLSLLVIGITLAFSLGVVIIVFAAVIAVALVTLLLPTRRKIRYPPSDYNKCLPTNQLTLSNGKEPAVNAPEKQGDDRS
jgi:hypothetical protein